MKRLILFLAVIFSVFSLNAVNPLKKKILSAEITFDLSYKGISDEDLEMMPKHVTYKVKGNNSLQTLESYSADGNSVITSIIANYDSLMMVNLNDAGENKQAIVYRNKDLVEAKNGMTVIVNKKSDTKIILGYLCNKYEVIFIDKKSGEKMKEEIYATEMIGGDNINFLFYNDVKGFILYSKKIDNDSTTIKEAKKIIKKDFNNSIFTIPEGYEITPFNND